MITTNNLTTTVEFGNESKANIFVDGPYRQLILQELATEKKVGDHLEAEDARELPRVELNFYNTKSIDVLIGALEHIKKNFNPPPENQFALAC